MFFTLQMYAFLYLKKKGGENMGDTTNRGFGTDRTDEETKRQDDVRMGNEPKDMDKLGEKGGEAQEEQYNNPDITSNEPQEELED